MTIGKSKKIIKKKGAKKSRDPFEKKVWFNVKAPNIFTKRFICKTPVNPTSGGKTSESSLLGRVYEVSLGDLNNDESKAYMLFKFRTELVQGDECLTDFYGMRFTTDKVQSLLRKWHTLIEGNVNVQTSDGYTLRLFCVAFTKRSKYQIKKTSYAKASQIREIRKRMVETMVKEASCTHKNLVLKLVSESVGKEVEKACREIYPLQNVYIRKVKVLKTPKVSSEQILELHKDVSKKELKEEIKAVTEKPEEVGEKVERKD